MEGSADYERLADWADRQIRKLQLALDLERARGDKATMLCLDYRDAMNRVWLERMRLRGGLNTPADEIDELISSLQHRTETLGD